jgi:hypothetical protein
MVSLDVHLVSFGELRVLPACKTKGLEGKTQLTPVLASRQAAKKAIFRNIAQCDHLVVLHGL